jgi:hypothetical protein
MIVAIHPSAGMTGPIIPLLDRAERVQEVDAVRIFYLVIITAGGAVIDNRGIFSVKGWSVEIDNGKLAE